MKKQKLIIRILGLLMLLFYIKLAFLLNNAGIEHSEALFLGEKAKLLFETDANVLQLLGTTYPNIIYFGTLLFSWIDYDIAPVILSCCFTALLYFLLLRDTILFGTQKKILVIALTILFVIHPGILFTAVSGRSVAGILLFFFLLYKSIFRYYRTGISYYLSMASIYFMGLIFCNYQFIWLIVTFLPFMVLISLDGLKTIKDEPPIIQYYQVVNNRSLRRKLIQRTIALCIIIFLLPVGAFFLFGMLNRYHAGSFTYFMESPYANWFVGAGTSLLTLDNTGTFQLQSQFVLQVYVLFISPVFVLALFYLKGAMFELMTAISPLLLLFILLIITPSYLTIEYYLIFLVLAFVLLPYWKHGKQQLQQKITFCILVVLNIITGFLYFSTTRDREEKFYATNIYRIFKDQKRVTKTETEEIATFISSSIPVTEKILIDDAAAYGIVAKLSTIKNIILPVQKKFLRTTEDPFEEATYLLIAKAGNPLSNTSILNTFYISALGKKYPYAISLAYQSDNWMIYRLRH